jgi:hypothetical protein
MRSAFSEDFAAVERVARVTFAGHRELQAILTAPPTASGVEGFDGKEVLTKIDYNARGAKIAEHQPVSTGAAPGAWDAASSAAAGTATRKTGRATCHRIIGAS